MTPAYSLLDINAGTTFDVSENTKLRARLSITNALNVLYISDAVNNAQYAAYQYGPEGGSGWAEVFVGPPTMVRLGLVLEMQAFRTTNHHHEHETLFGHCDPFCRFAHRCVARQHSRSP